MDVLREHRAQRVNDVRALWRRILFSVLTSNIGDQLRNHSFFYVSKVGWVLSPAYDSNPVAVDRKTRILPTVIDCDYLNLAVGGQTHMAVRKREENGPCTEVLGHL